MVLVLLVLVLAPVVVASRARDTDATTEADTAPV